MSMRKEKPAMRLRTTALAEKTIQAAYALASSDGSGLAQSQHLLMALVQEPQNISTLLLGQLGISPQDLNQEITRTKKERPVVSQTDAPSGKGTAVQTRPGTIIPPTEEAWAFNRAALLDPARDAAQRLGDTTVGTKHLLLGLLLEDDTAGYTLNQLGVTWERVEGALSELQQAN